MLVVHPHFHRRRTGVTAHTETIVRAMQAPWEAKALGRHLAAGTPRIGWSELWRRSRSGSEAIVWHAHRNNEVLVALVLRALGCALRIVFTRHGSSPPGWLTRWLFRRVDALITLNAEVAKLVQWPSTVVHHGVSLDVFRPPADRDAAWQQLALGGAAGLGVIGRLRPEKGQHDFVAAVAPLLEQHAAWVPVLVGLAKDEGWASTLRAPRLVRAGEQPDVRPWYAGLRIVVHPSYRESFSMVLLEAMASGCCVVATRIGDVPAVITDGETGFLFEPGDVDGLRGILSRLMEDPALVERVGRAARANVEARFGVAKEAQALAAVYARAQT